MREAMAIRGVSGENISRQTAELAVSTKVFYGIGEIAITAQMALFGLFLLFFYNSVMGLPATLVGIAAAAGLFWDALVDPYIGYRSDSCRSRLGRRHPYMLIGACSMGLAFWLLWSPPANLGTAGLFLWLLGAMLIYRLSSALFRIPYLSLAAEMSQDYHDRTSIVGIRSFFGLCGAMAAAALSFYLFFPNIAAGVDPKLNYSSYPKMGLAFGIVMTAAGLLATAGTLARRSSDLSTGTERAASDLKGFLSGVGLALRNPSFRKVWLSFSLFFIAVVLNSVVSIHYFTWYVRITDSRVLGGIQWVFYLSALAGVLFWLAVSRRAEKLRLYLVAILATAGLLFGGTFVFGEGNLFGTGKANPLLFGYVLAGFFASALSVLPASMLADVADEDELVNGLRREGIFFGILNFGEKIAAGVSLLIGGGLVDYFAGLNPGQLEQSPTTIFRIGLVYGLTPGVMLLAAAFLVLGYGLDRQRVLAIQTEIKRRRELGLATAEEGTPCGREEELGASMGRARSLTRRELVAPAGFKRPLIL